MDWMCLLYGCQKVDERAIHRERCHALLPPTATPIWQQATVANPFDDAICLLKLLVFTQNGPFRTDCRGFVFQNTRNPKINEIM